MVTTAIRGHPTFETTYWEALFEQHVEPPFNPQIKEVVQLLYLFPVIKIMC
jgi:hypothetical protein